MANGWTKTRGGIREHVRGMDQSGWACACSPIEEHPPRRRGSKKGALAALDWVIGSVHGYMNLGSGTDRLLRALECPHLRVLDHPTGRIFCTASHSPSISVIAAEAARRNIHLEINASPERLISQAHSSARRRPRVASCDLDRRASSKHLANMGYGIPWRAAGVAERGDVANTLPPVRSGD
jgi:DNA polymerase (family 10)